MKDKQRYKKRIFILTDAFSGGGAEEVMNVFSDELSKHFEILHVSKRKGPKNYKLQKYKVALNIKRLSHAIPKILNMIKDFNPDIVFSSTGHNNLLLLLFKRMSLLNNTKVIIRESSVASIMNAFNIKSLIIDKLFTKYLYKEADIIIAQCNDIANDLIENYDLPTSKIVTINNPVLNTIVYNNNQEDSWLVEENRIHLVTIGRLSKEKGYLRLLDIIKKLPDEYVLSIIGDGIQKGEIVDKITQLDLSGRVSLLGFLQEESKVEILQNSDIYIQTSYVEGFPNSLLQAAYLGVPIIAYDVPGGTSDIVSEKLGILVNDNNQKEIIDSILNIKFSKYPKHLMQKEIISKFGMENISPILLRLFREI